ncbi:MAG TPA: MFS transporter [Myxococcaceae bacterium]|nr:MFS transporter [Myxococcaceae bacterium]
MSRDRNVLFATAFLRSTGTSLVGVLLGVYLAKLHLAASQIGLVVGLGLAGAAVAALVVTVAGDRLGRRRTLAILACIGAAGTLVAASSSRLDVLAAAAFVGMLNGMGRDRGAALVLEQAILPGVTGEAQRTLGFAWYSAAQDVGHALGALLAGAPLLVQRWAGVEDLTSFRWVLGANSVLLLVTALLYRFLSGAAERASTPRLVTPSSETRSALWKLSALFGIDSLAGGFLTTALLSFFFFERFGVSEAVIGLLFFGARLANTASHFGAAWIASRIGLVRTMVYTHLPSSLLLLTVPFAPTFPIAAGLFLLREGLVEMDVPTRQSYVMAIVRPEERTFASGVTNLVRLGGWAVAPAFAGALMQGASLGAPLIVGAGMKILYDVLLYRAFKERRPPEELRG